ncbi:MAG: S8 family serine peptidase [Candidatus Fermentibacteraceae bacterium]|nr:S8 family serine peptidase [Candidatus Fermentibacteraceae bacterium]
MRHTASILFVLLCVSISFGSDNEAWWVFFADRGPGVQERLSRRTLELMESPSWDRRVSIGLLQADELDLEPWRDYVRLVAETPCCEGIRTASRYLNAVSVRVSAGDVHHLLALPFVSGVRPVAASAFRMPELAPCTGRFAGLTDLQLGQIGLDKLHQRGWLGQGVVIGVLDSGFNLVHEVFAGIEVIAMYDFVDDDPDPSQQPEDPPGQSNHGTAVLSVIGGYKTGEFVGGAPEASFILAKTEDISDEYQAEEDYWVAGLEWIESRGGQLVNSSLAYIDWYSYEDLDGNTAVTTIAADAAASRGMVVFNSIGNAGPGEGTLMAPSDGDSVFAAGAVDIEGAVAEFSSRGPTFDGRTKPDCCALGQGVTLASYQGASGYYQSDGTSFSSPLVASAAAALRGAHPEWDMVEIMDILRLTASQSGAPDNDMGYGIIDAYAALKYRSLTGVVRFSSTCEPLPDYPITVIMGDSVFQTETNSSGWFAFCPGQTGPFTVSHGGGEGSVIPVTGVLGDQGVDIVVFVDQEPGGASPTVFPNPSTEGVYVGFDLTEGPVAVQLSVFEITGQLVYRSVREDVGPGSYRAPLPGEAFYWDGTCSDGSAVASGVYIISLRYGDTVRLMKCSLVR